MRLIEVDLQVHIFGGRDPVYVDLLNSDPSVFDRLRYLIPTEVRDEIHFVILDKDRIVAVAGLEQSPYKLDQLWVKHYSVDPEYQNQRLGTQLVQAVFEYARKTDKTLVRSESTEMGKQYLSRVIDRMKQKYPSVRVIDPKTH